MRWPHRLVLRTVVPTVDQTSHTLNAQDGLRVGVLRVHTSQPHRGWKLPRLWDPQRFILGLHLHHREQQNKSTLYDMQRAEQQ